MATAIRQFSRNSIVYAIGTFTQRGASFLLVPVYTSVLAVTEYGALETLTTMVLTFQILVSLGLNSSLIRFYNECKNEQEVMRMVRTSFLILLGVSLCLFILILPSFQSLGRIFLKDETYGLYVTLAFLWSSGEAMKQLLFSYYRARQDAGTYVAFSMGFFVFLISLNVILVRFAGLGIIGVLVGNLIVNWGMSIIGIIKFWQRGKTVSIQWARKLLQFGFPLIFSMFGWMILHSADRYFLAYYRGLSEVGFYSLGYKIGLITQIAVITPFQLGWPAFSFTRFSEDKFKAIKDFSRLFTYLIFVYCVFGVSALLFSNEIIDILGSAKFPHSVVVVPYVLLAYLFFGIYYWAATYFHLRKKTTWLSGVVFSMAVLNVLLNLLWTPTWGWEGAALATVITIGGAGILTLFISRRLIYVPLQKLRLVKLGLGILVVYSSYLILPLSSVSILNVIERLLLILLFPLFLLLVRFFEPNEINFLLSLPLRIKTKYYTFQDKLNVD